MICKDGHENQAGGCCCPLHGNTCGFHPEYTGVTIAARPKPKKSEPLINTLEELAASSPAWEARLKSRNEN